MAGHLVPGRRGDQPPHRPGGPGPLRRWPHAPACGGQRGGQHLNGRYPMDSRTTWPALIGALIKGETLTADEAAWAMNEIMEGAATPTQIAGFGVALRMKGESPAELSGLAETMLNRATPVDLPDDVVDLVGTGG